MVLMGEVCGEGCLGNEVVDCIVGVVFFDGSLVCFFCFGVEFGWFFG